MDHRAPTAQLPGRTPRPDENEVGPHSNGGNPPAKFAANHRTQPHLAEVLTCPPPDDANSGTNESGST